MNPYQVLGVSTNATKEEIRSAYLALVKKYHPDRYQDSDLKAQAEEKMKQINAAYDMLTKEPAAGSSASSYGGGAYGGSYGGSSYGGSSYGGSYAGSSYGGYGNYDGGFGSGAYSTGTYGSAEYSGSYQAEFRRVRSLINSGNVDSAEAILNGIPVKNAEYYFLYGMCQYRRGRYAAAYEFISRACSMAPDNVEYSNVLYALRGAGSTYGRSYPASGGMDYCGLCSAMLCANMLCRCARF